MEIWQNGVKRASNAATPTRTTDSNPFCIGQATGVLTSDLADYGFLYVVPFQATGTEIINLTNSPFAIIAPPPATKFYSYATPATGNRRRRILCAGRMM